MALTGRLLVATPLLGDENFRRAVVLLIDHGPAGAFGVVLNRPSDQEVSSVLPVWQPLASPPAVLFVGGPVAADSALALAAAAPGTDPLGWRAVSGILGLVDLDTPAELLTDGLHAVRVFAGYAGWGAGQLEGEIAQGAWYVVDADPADPFSPDPQALWRAVLRRQPGDLAMVASFPDDPSLN